MCGARVIALICRLGFRLWRSPILVSPVSAIISIFFLFLPPSAGVYVGSYSGKGGAELLR